MEQDPRTPRRLFSFDSVKPSRRSSSESAATEESSSSSRKHGRAHSKPRAPTLNQVSEENEHWLSNDFTASPKSTTPEPNATHFDTRKHPLPPSKSPKPRPLPPLLTDVTVSQPDAAPPSPSVIRWNTIRQHVRKKPTQQSQTSSHSASTSASTLNTSAQSHGRSTTPIPKPSSRLAQRLGFRNVVEQVQREASVGTSAAHSSGAAYNNPADDARRHLTAELQKACVAARYIEHGSQSNHSYSNFKGETNKTNNSNIHRTQNSHNHTLSGSALSLPLPFMSSTSLVQEASSQTQGNTANTHTHARTHSYSESNGVRVMGSIKPLYQVLLQYSQHANAARLPVMYLPCESLVLSTLLMPFLRPDRGKDQEEQSWKDGEQEQWFAIESFEIIVKTWNPPEELSALERILWVIKAACPPANNSYRMDQTNSSQPLQIRLRLFNTLWSLLVNTETFYPTTSPQVLISVFHALFGLQALLAGEVEAENKTRNFSTNHNMYNYAEVKVSLGQKEREDARILRDLINQVRRGSSGDLEDLRVEEEYNALFIDRDEREGDKIREAVELEGLARALEYGFGGTGREEGGGKRWILEWGVEEYWPPPAPGGDMTPLQTAIHARILGNFTRACMVFLASTSSPSQDRNQSQTPRRIKDATLVIRALQTRVLPELEIIERDSYGDGGKGGSEGIEEAKRNVVRIVLEVAVIGWACSSGEEDLFSEGLGRKSKEGETLRRWAVGMICGWYREGDKGRWKTCFEKVFSDLVSIHPWPRLLLILHALLHLLPDDVRRPAVVSLLPMLSTRIVDDPPPLGLSFEVNMNAGSGTPSPSSPLNDSTYSTSLPKSPASPSERSSSYFPPLSPNATASHPLTSLLTRISQLYPAIFYKPLFLCAAATKEYAVVNHLCSVVSMAKWVKGFWTGSGSPQSGGAEMVCVAIMSDIPGSQSSGDNPRWISARLGQSALILELVAVVQQARRVKEESSTSASPSAGGLFESKGVGESIDLGSVTKFAVDLESRLAILIEAKEKTRLISPTQRLLFSILFREIRLLTRSMKNASWLPRFVGWFNEYHELSTGSSLEGGQEAEEDAKSDFDEEIMDSVDKLKELYSAAREGTRGHSKHRSTILFSIRDDTSRYSSNSISSIFMERMTLLDVLEKGFQARILKLLVAMSVMIPMESHRALGGLLWEQYLDPRDLEKERDGKALSSVCFLFMQCAEKTPDETLKIMKDDLYSSDSKIRLAAVRKITILVNWRFQIMSQHVIADRARRPFKIARGPLPFVATDMGSNHFVLELDPNDAHDKLPVELRKKLAEIGWDNNDSPVNHHLEWVRTPMSLLPGMQIDKIHSNGAAVVSNDIPASPNLSPMPSPSRGSPLEEKVEEMALLRRNSSSGGPLAWSKRRAIWVPSLSQLFPRVAALAFDQDFEVACASRSVITDLMRNDPAMLTRPVWDLLTGDRTDLSIAVSSLYTFIHIRKSIPPAMAHNIFNSLAGFVKFASKQLEGEETLQKFARVAPVMASVVSQVSEISIRELRRAKMDLFFIPSGSLWFPPSAPSGAMFPRGRSRIESPFEDIPDRLVSITMLRIAQNMLFLSMLKRNPAEVQAVRKNMVRLVLPSLDAGQEAAPVELKDLVPCRTPPEPPNVKVAKVRSLSILLSRSHLLLVAQIFRSISRHLNDRNELAVLLDGVNRILLAHGNDIGIVSHSMIALMVASTRFRRLFASGGGYTLFMPAVFKIYVESEAHSGIRNAIEYAVSRFFAYHQETFIFQSLDSISHILFLPDIDGEWITKNAYSLFASLRKGAPSTTHDAAGIHDANKTQEREALMLMTADEKPQTFLASLHKGGPNQNGRPRVTVDLPVEYENKRLAMDDFVRMFLTVIAHDVTISRAQQFLKFLRFLIPHLYEASQSTRNVLTDGVDALGVILSKGQLKGKPADTVSRAEEEPDIQSLLYSSEKQSFDKSKSPSDPWVMRYDYLHLVVSFTQAGGKLSAETSRTIFELGRGILSAYGDFDGHMGSIFADYTRASLIPKGGRSVKGVKNYLRDFVSLFTGFPDAVDWTGVLEVIKTLAQNPNYNNDPTFCQLVVNQICGAGLAACDSAKDGLPRLPYRTALVSLMTEVIFLPGADIFGELEKRSPQNDFLAWVVLPFALSMKTVSDIEREKVNVDLSYRTSQARAWLRLLSYTMSCCQLSAEPSRSSGSTRSKNADEKSQTRMSSLLMALQVIKVIVIRAEKDLTTCLPDVWSRLGTFLKHILIDGSAEFGLRAHEHTPSASPLPSPRASGQFDLSMPSISKTSTFSGRSYLRPRVVDYCLWSILGLLCAYRSPLYLQIHAFMHEKVRILDEELRHQERNLSLASPRSRRPSSSVFTKPRLSFSSNVSPEASPRLVPTSMPPSPDPFRTSFQSLQLGTSTETATSEPGSGPRIVHLGLISNQNRRSASPSGTSMRSMAKSTKLKSMVLIRKTFLRVRTVQQSMGYSSRLLPMPTVSIDRTMSMDYSEEEPAARKIWTRWKALQEIMIETKELMAEFDESLQDLDDDMVIVDAEQSAVL